MRKKSAARTPPSPARQNAVAISRLRPALVAEGIRFLSRVDPILKSVIQRVGPFRLKTTRNHYHALARAIVAQQISGHAARTIWGRIEQLGAPEPLSAEIVMTLPDESLRSAGLSPQKLRYFRDLSQRVAEGRLSLAKLAKMSDELVIESLVEVTGIGVWTAQMFLMFSLGRADVFAPDDLGIRTAIRNLYSLEVLPNKALALQIAEPWQPYRSIASWYLWRSLDLKK